MFKYNKFTKKVVGFIKYHNAFVVGILAVFLAGSVLAMSDTAREAVLGKSTVEKQGIDNTALLTMDFGAFDFQTRIDKVLEDDANYYISYSFNDFGVKEHRWQKVRKQGDLEVSKQELGDGDLGLFAVEEISEVINSRRLVLLKTQKNERKRGRTRAVQTTEYSGLLGLALEPKTQKIAGYTPVVKPDREIPRRLGAGETVSKGEEKPLASQRGNEQPLPRQEAAPTSTIDMPATTTPTTTAEMKAQLIEMHKLLEQLQALQQELDKR